MATHSIIIPGIGGSGPEHWQSIWQATDRGMSRIQPRSWEHPELDDWLEALDRAVAAASGPPLLIAHSLGCLLAAHWAMRSSRPAAGALLVAIPDPAGLAFPVEKAASFLDVPRQPLRFPALVIASADDPYADLSFVKHLAQCWSARLVVAGALGHINAAAGLGDWPRGAGLLAGFRAGLSLES